jgi:hypothetical protein
MHADRSDSKTESETVRHCGAHQQRSGETRTLGVGDRVQVRLLGAGLVQDFADERDQPPNMVARRELRHDASVRIVQRHLRMQRVREQAAAAVVDSDPGFVAGGLDPKHEHDSSVLSFCSVSLLSGAFD